MTALGTAFFAAMAIGLLIESALAWLRHRVLSSTNAAFAYGVGAMGVVSVLSRAIGPDHDALRQMSGWAVAASFACCIAVDLANRRRTPQQPSSG